MPTHCIQASNTQPKISRSSKLQTARCRCETRWLQAVFQDALLERMIYAEFVCEKLSGNKNRPDIATPRLASGTKACAALNNLKRKAE